MSDYGRRLLDDVEGGPGRFVAETVTWLLIAGFFACLAWAFWPW